MSALSKTTKVLGLELDRWLFSQQQQAEDSIGAEFEREVPLYPLIAPTSPGLSFPLGKMRLVISACWCIVKARI